MVNKTCLTENFIKNLKVRATIRAVETILHINFCCMVFLYCDYGKKL